MSSHVKVNIKQRGNDGERMEEAAVSGRFPVDAPRIASSKRPVTRPSLVCLILDVYYLAFPYATRK